MSNGSLDTDPKYRPTRSDNVLDKQAVGSCHQEEGVPVAITIPSTPSQTSLTRFLTHIQNASVPAKVNGPYLKSVGFKSGNDNYLVPILKHIGFLGQDGTPTKDWRSYRDKSRASHVLAEGIKRGYAGLFEIYEDAYRKDDEALRNWIRGVTEYDETKVTQCLATFKTLVAHADFSQTGSGRQNSATTNHQSAVPASADTTIPVAAAPAITSPQNGPSSPTVNINIELHLPSSTDSASYDHFFAAMKKHLFPDA